MIFQYIPIIMKESPKMKRIIEIIKVNFLPFESLIGIRVSRLTREPKN